MGACLGSRLRETPSRGLARTQRIPSLLPYLPLRACWLHRHAAASTALMLAPSHIAPSRQVHPQLSLTFLYKYPSTLLRRPSGTLVCNPALPLGKKDDLSAPFRGRPRLKNDLSASSSFCSFYSTLRLCLSISLAASNSCLPFLSYHSYPLTSSPTVTRNVRRRSPPEPPEICPRQRGESRRVILDCRGTRPHPYRSRQARRGPR